MSNEEIVVLIQSGQKEYISTLWVQCERFIWRKAKKFKLLYNCSPEIEDLAQCGIFALCKAIEYFRADSGLKFLTYLARPLKTEFLRASGWLTPRRDALDGAESLDSLIENGNDAVPLLELIPDTDEGFFRILENIFQETVSMKLAEALKSLPDKQQLLIMAIYYKGMTETDAGRFAGYRTKQAAEFAHYSALRKLRTGRFRGELLELLRSYK